jgi:hypothetical protein
VDGVTKDENDEMYGAKPYANPADMAFYKKGAAAGNGGKATVKAAVINGNAIIEIDGDTIILDAIGEAVEEAAKQRAEEKQDKSK